MNRRDLLALLCAATGLRPGVVSAQPPARTLRVGVLMPLAEGDPQAQRRLGALKEGLREFGWIEGQNIAFELRYAGDKRDRLNSLASELVQTKVDVIVTSGSQLIEAVRSTTRTIPIVMAVVGDAVGAGYIASLSRPGGNLTGLRLGVPEQGAKRLQLLKEMVPGATRVAALWHSGAAGPRIQLREMEGAAPGLGIALQSLPVTNVASIEDSLLGAAEAKAQAII